MKVLKILCDILIKWGIDPITLAKAIGIFLLLVMLIVVMMTFPVLFVLLLIIAMCVTLIALIYLMLE